MTGLEWSPEPLKGLISAVGDAFQGGWFYGPSGGRMAAFLGLFFFFILILVAVVLVLWIALPFSLFGIKGLLKRCIEEQEKTNALLKRLVDKEESPKPPEDINRPF